MGENRNFRLWLPEQGTVLSIVGAPASLFQIACTDYRPMSLLLLISLILRLGAFLWCLLLLYRIRDWRIGLLALAIGLGIWRLLWIAQQPLSWPVTLEATGQAWLSIVLSLLIFVVVFVVARTITQFRDAMTALKQSEEKFSRAFQASPFAITISRVSDGTLIDVNRAFEEFVGISKEQVIGRSSLDLRMWVDDRDRQRLVDQVTRHGRLTNYEILVRSHSGDLATCLLSADTFEFAGETHLITVTRDVTHQKQLQRQLLEASDREQTRIAHDLHDSVAQDLVGISLLIKALEDARDDGATDLSQEFETLKKLVHKAISNTRLIAQGISPIELRIGDFNTALGRLCSAMSDLYGKECTLAFSADTYIANDIMALNLYRIVQEAVRNAMKHSDCSTVTVDVAEQDRSIALTIKDDGVGIDTRPRSSKGMGINIIRYRANMLGGTASFENGADGGTVVRCVVPVDPESKQVAADASQVQEAVSGSHRAKPTLEH